MLGSVLETDALVLTACARTAESNPYDNFMFACFSKEKEIFDPIDFETLMSLNL